MDIAQAAFLVVDQVLAGTVAMYAAGHDDFGIFRIQGTITIINNDGNFGKAHGGTFFGTAENHVLHLAHTERRSFLFAQDPADGIRNVGLATAVRSHHGSQAFRGEVDFGPLGEGLESKNL